MAHVDGVARNTIGPVGQFLDREPSVGAGRVEPEDDGISFLGGWIGVPLGAAVDERFALLSEKIDDSGSILSSLEFAGVHVRLDHQLLDGVGGLGRNADDQTGSAKGVVRIRATEPESDVTGLDGLDEFLDEGEHLGITLLVDSDAEAVLTPCSGPFLVAEDRQLTVVGGKLSVFGGPLNVTAELQIENALDSSGADIRRQLIFLAGRAVLRNAIDVGRTTENITEATDAPLVFGTVVGAEIDRERNAVVRLEDTAIER